MKSVLARYVPIANMLTNTFGADCEVVIHDLDDPVHSVVYVSNNTVTNRRIGDSFDQLVRQVLLSSDLKEDYVANYYFTAANGKRIRSSTVLIKDDNGHLEGAVCINLDTTRIAQHIAFLNSFLPTQVEQVETIESPATQDNASDNIVTMIDNLMDRIIGNDNVQSMTRDERIAKVRFMDSKGIFLMKGSVDKAAEKLRVNKVTIYSYLDEARGKR